MEQTTVEQSCYHGRKDSGTCSGSTDKAVSATPHDNKTNVATLGQTQNAGFREDKGLE